MSRQHGWYAELKSILIASFVVAAIAAIGIARDVAIQWIGRQDDTVKLRVAVTRAVFADAVRAIGGLRVDVFPLIISSKDPDAVEDRIDDFILRTSDVIVAGGPIVDPEISIALDRTESRRARIVDASNGMSFLTRSFVSSTIGESFVPPDLNFWLDADNAVRMMNTIRDALVSADPINANAYRERALEIGTRIREADAAYARTLSVCRARVFIEGGGPHFSYLARRYNILYYAVQPLPSGEIPPLLGYAAVAGTNELQFIFYDADEDARLAGSVARLSNASLLPLISGSEMYTTMGASPSLVEMMRLNLDGLVRGMECRSEY